MRSLAVLVLVGALLALLAGCKVITVESPGPPESDELDIEVGRKDNVNGISTEPE
ncbi:MAG: hypothetical protein IH945_12410 [Armatimonadetes bacterium]|nr:hypothetical protein [Armatimonadota bacterium]